MTQSSPIRCGWCGERFPVPGGPGRPPKYCRRSHRQRAYEARRVAQARGLASDEILVSTETWFGLRDAIYVAETAATDAELDLADARNQDDLIAIVSNLRRAIAAVVGAVGEPRAVGAGIDASQ